MQSTKPEAGLGLKRRTTTEGIMAESDLWQQIDTSESFLVCCMFEEAISQASSVIRHIHTTTEAIGEPQLAEMRESAGMVFVQSLKELGRSSELFVELEKLFGSVAEIPAQVFLTGACMHISEGLLSNLQSIFAEFLSKWTYSEGEGYFLQTDKPQSSSRGNMKLFAMHAEKYLEVAEVYAITFLGMVLRKPDLAISWTEKAQLPERNRQDMLLRLRSLHSTAEPRPSESIEVTESVQVPFVSSSRVPKTINQSKSTMSKSIIPTIDRLSERMNPCLGWFHTVRLRYGNAQLVVPRGKTLFLGLLLVFAYNIYRKKGVAFKRIIAGKFASVKRVLSDAWQLAFSVNVNPLAAVQQLPSAPHGSRCNCEKQAKKVIMYGEANIEEHSRVED